ESKDGLQYTFEDIGRKTLVVELTKDRNENELKRVENIRIVANANDDTGEDGYRTHAVHEIFPTEKWNIDLKMKNADDEIGKNADIIE
ncbi:hypothetical protein JTB14_004752, partial [Gonioctena quinquepunctata]